VETLAAAILSHLETRGNRYGRRQLRVAVCLTIDDWQPGKIARRNVNVVWTWPTSQSGSRWKDLSEFENSPAGPVKISNLQGIAWSRHTIEPKTGQTDSGPHFEARKTRE